MKNKKIIISLILNIFFAVFLVWGIIYVLRFDQPVVITKEFFENKMNEINCLIIDNTFQNRYADLYITTDSTSCPYDITYVISKDDNYLSSLMKEVEMDVKNNGDITSSSSIILDNLYFETSTTGKQFKIATYNNNSILFSSTQVLYKDNLLEIYNDFDYHYTPNMLSFVLISFVLILLFISLFIYLFFIKNKIDGKGWKMLIPIYNIAVLSKDVFGSYWYCLLYLIPAVNVIAYLLLFYKLGRKFEKSPLFSILLILLPMFFLPVLAFDNSSFNKVLKVNSKYVAKNNSLLKIILLSISFFLILISCLFLLIYIDEKLCGYLFLFILFIYFSILSFPGKLFGFKSNFFSLKVKIILWIFGFVLFFLALNWFNF